MMDLRRHRLARFAKAIYLGLAFAVLLQGRGSAAVSLLQPVAPPPAGKLYHGVYPGGQSGMEDDLTVADVQSYEQTVEKRVAWVYFSDNWYAGKEFPLATATWIWQGGAVPFVRLMLREEEESTPNRFSIEEVLAGTFDSDFRSWAREARAFANPLLVEFGTECNGSWFPWNGLYHGAGTLNGYGDPEKPDGPERFVAAFQRIVTLMRGEGASNITWVFHVDATDDPEVGWNRLENYYPGDAFVDWIGVSAYGPQSPTDQEYSSFRQQMDPVYARLTALAPNKPVIVAEFGATADSRLIAPEAWATPAFNDILGNRWPRLIGFSWWNEHWQNDDNPAHDSNMRVQDIPALAALIRTKIATDVVISVALPHFAVVADAGSDSTIASGGSTVLHGSASGGLPPYSYSWSPTTGLDDPTEAQPTASPSNTTSYTLRVTDDLGQTDADTVLVTVVPPVVAETGHSKTIEAGGQTTLQGSVSGGLPPYTYSWSPSTGLNDPNIAQPTAAPASTTTYTLTVTDDLGQTDTDTVTVTVTSGVVAAAGPDRMIASGESTALQGAASGGWPPYTYAWSPTEGLSDASASQPVASPASTTTYTLTVSDDYGQTDTDTVTVTMATAVVAEAGSETTVAAGGSKILQGSASGGVPPYAYSWSPTTGLSSPNVAQPTASPTSAATYILTVTDDLGQSDVDTVTVTMLSEMFSDVPEGHWASAEIAACVNAGIVSGYDDGQCHGEWPVDRAQMAVYIARAQGWVRIGDDMTTAPELFRDVPRGYWAGAAIEACVDHEVSSGYVYPDPNNPGATISLYEPAGIVTRDQMAVYMARSMVDPVGEDGLAGYVPADPRNFLDVPDTGYGPDGTEPFWAYRHVEYCVEHGVVDGYGDGYYHPDWDVTRDQTAVYVARAFGLLD